MSGTEVWTGMLCCGCANVNSNLGSSWLILYFLSFLNFDFHSQPFKVSSRASVFTSKFQTGRRAKRKKHKGHVNCHYLEVFVPPETTCTHTPSYHLASEKEGKLRCQWDRREEADIGSVTISICCWDIPACSLYLIIVI